MSSASAGVALTGTCAVSHQAMQFMQLIPECQRPVAGTDGALQRRRKLLTQLPIYDQDPVKCQSLASEEEVHCSPVIKHCPFTTHSRWGRGEKATL